MNGKGDSPRNCFSARFKANYEAIFGKRRRRTAQRPVPTKGK